MAIALMVVDHFADMILAVQIEPTTIRLWTRLSMPLFCCLMGYFLIDATAIRWQRFFQVLLAAAATSLITVAMFGKLEILSSLAACYLLFALLREKFLGLIAVVCLFHWDVSRSIFDYPLSIVMPCVAQGMILRRAGLRWAVASGLGLTLSAAVVEVPTRYVLLFVLPATLMIAWGERRPELRVPGISQLGKHPLTTYIVQYYVLYGIYLGYRELR